MKAELKKFLEHIVNNVGKVITEYHWREACELILQLEGDNNSWIKIESEDDLPTPVLNMEYYFIILEKEIGESAMVRGWTDKTGKYFINNETYSTIYFEDMFYKVTHYQSIIKPKPPIY